MPGLKSCNVLGRSTRPSLASTPRARCIPSIRLTHESRSRGQIRYFATTPDPGPPPQTPSSSTSSSPKFKWPRLPLPPLPPPDQPSKKGFQIRVAYVFFGLTSVALLIAIYGMLEFYYALPKWPESVRTPLRKALRAKNMKEFDRADKLFKEALIAALALPPSEFDPDPLLKLSGLYITYATLLEEFNQKVEAYTTLRDALKHFGSSSMSSDPSQRVSAPWAGNVPLTQEDHIRAIALSQKLGQLALILATGSKVYVYPVDDETGPKSYLDAAEKHLSDALTAMLHLGLAPAAPGSTDERKRVIAGRDVDLPASSGNALEGGVESAGGSVDRRGLGVTMEALAEVYSRKGEYGIAGNLLIQSISTLLPPGSKETPSIPDRCQAALLMTTVSSHALHPHTPKAIKAAKSWSLRALQIADGAVQEAAGSSGDIGNTIICRRALAVGSYNLGMLAELEGNKEESARKFDTALKVSRDIGFHEGQRLAGEGIRRVRASLTENPK